VSTPPAELARDAATARGALLGVLVGCALFTVMGAAYRDFKPDEVGLGRNTIIGKAAPIDGVTPSGHLPALTTLSDAARKWRADGYKIALWIGNSQLHGLNRPEQGGALAVEYAQKAADARGAKLRYLQVSSPAIAYQDVLSAYLAFRAKGTLPDTVLIQVTYANFRDMATRHELNLELFQSFDWPALVAIGGPGVARFQADVEALVQGQQVEEDLTPQQALERFLIAQIESVWQAYADRGLVDAGLRTRYETLQASLAGAHFQRGALTISAANDATSQAALDSLIRLAKHDGVDLTLYQAPHRQDLEQF
jgi:hypothetical protein